MCVAVGERKMAAGASPKCQSYWPLSHCPAELCSLGLLFSCQSEGFTVSPFSWVPGGDGAVKIRAFMSTCGATVGRTLSPQS